MQWIDQWKCVNVFRKQISKMIGGDNTSIYTWKHKRRFIKVEDFDHGRRRFAPSQPCKSCPLTLRLRIQFHLCSVNCAGGCTGTCSGGRQGEWGGGGTYYSELSSEEEEDGEPLTQYELQRKRNINRNNRTLLDLGFKPAPKPRKNVAKV